MSALSCLSLRVFVFCARILLVDLPSAWCSSPLLPAAALCVCRLTMRAYSPFSSPAPASSRKIFGITRCTHTTHTCRHTKAQMRLRFHRRRLSSLCSLAARVLRMGRCVCSDRHGCGCAAVCVGVVSVCATDATAGTLLSGGRNGALRFERQQTACTPWGGDTKTRPDGRAHAQERRGEEAETHDEANQQRDLLPGPPHHTARRRDETRGTVGRVGGLRRRCSVASALRTRLLRSTQQARWPNFASRSHSCAGLTAEADPLSLHGHGHPCSHAGADRCRLRSSVQDRARGRQRCGYDQHRTDVEVKREQDRQSVQVIEADSSRL